MGQNSPIPSSEPIANQFSSLFNYQRTHEPYLLRHPHDKKLAFIHIFSIHKQHTISHCQYYSQRKLLSCDQTLKLIDFQIQTTQQQILNALKPTSSKDQFRETKIALLAEHVKTSLQEEIINRQNKQPFDEVQLWSVISSCVMGAISLIEGGFKEPILSPKGIMLTEDGTIKVGEWELICGRCNHQTFASGLCQQKINDFVSNYYWDPKGILAIQQATMMGKISNTFHQQDRNSQIFSLGMTLISMCMRKLIYQIETFGEKQLSHLFQLAVRTRELENQPLSQKMKSTIKNMIAWEQEERINYFGLRDLILDEFETQQFPHGSSIHSFSNNKSSSIDIFLSNSGIGNKDQSMGFSQNYEGSGMAIEGVGDNYIPEEDNEQFKCPHSLSPLPPDSEDYINKHESNKQNFFITNFENQNPDLFEGGSEELFCCWDQNRMQNSRSTNQDVGEFAVFQTTTMNEENKSLFTDPKLLEFIKGSIQSKSQSYLNDENRHPNFEYARNEHKRLVKQEFAKGYYEGEKKNHMRNGYGIFYYHEGGKYKGNWRNNQMHGKGTLEYSDGRIAYQGDWCNDQLHGKGILYNETPLIINGSLDYSNFGNCDQSWLYYDGEFVHDDKHGFGLLVISNGEQFMGEFKNDMIDGIGEFIRSDRSVVKGRWKQNKLISLIE